MLYHVPRGPVSSSPPSSLSRPIPSYIHSQETGVQMCFAASHAFLFSPLRNLIVCGDWVSVLSFKDCLVLLIQQAWKNCTTFLRSKKNGGAEEMTTVTTQHFLRVWIMEQELCSLNWPLCHAWEAGHQGKMSPCGSLATWRLECLIALLGSCGFVWACTNEPRYGSLVHVLRTYPTDSTQ